MRSAVGYDLPAYKLVELIDASFWPTWPENDEGSKTVEPDVFLRFRAGDPEVRIDIIVEAKYRPGYDQYADQWRRQWKAYHDFVAEDDGASAYLLAVGGLGRHTGTTVRQIYDELSADGLEVKVVAADWSRLLDVVVAELGGVEAIEERRLLEDIVEAMALAGFRQIRPMKDLVPRNLNASSKHIMRDYDYR